MFSTTQHEPSLWGEMKRWSDRWVFPDRRTQNVVVVVATAASWCVHGRTIVYIYFKLYCFKSWRRSVCAGLRYSLVRGSVKGWEVKFEGLIYLCYVDVVIHVACRCVTWWWQVKRRRNYVSISFCKHDVSKL